MHIKLVIFDLGSTLVFFQGNWDRVINEATEMMSKEIISMGYPINQDALCKKYNAALQNYYIERDIDNLERTTVTLLDELLQKNYGLFLTTSELHQALDAFYLHTGDHWKLEEDAISTLQALKADGYHLGLISNASYARDVYGQLEKNALEPYFEQVLVSAEVGYRKPHKFIFQQALDFFAIPPQEAVMIGDTLNADIIGSRRMGMKNIWIARWASAPTTHYRDDMIVPDRTIQRLSQIPALLKNW